MSHERLRILRGPGLRDLDSRRETSVLFQKTLDFFRAVFGAFRPAAGGTFGRIEMGGVWYGSP